MYSSIVEGWGALRIKIKAKIQTVNADVAGGEVRGKVAVTRLQVDEGPDAYVTPAPPRTLVVQQTDDVSRTSDVVVVMDAPANCHPAVFCRSHQDDGITGRARDVEIFSQTIFTRVRLTKYYK